MATTSQPPTTPTAASCPVCGTPVIPTEARCCERCDTPHHADCWEYAGGCAIFGCARECASHSRESSLSSPSSPPSPPAFHRWFWLYRIYAYALSLTTLGLVPVIIGQLTVNLLGAVAPDLGLPDRFMFTTLPFSLFALLWQVVAAVTSLAFFVTMTTALPARFLRYRAEGALSVELVPPQEGVRSVLDRLDTGPVGSGLLRFLRLAQPWAVLARPLGLALIAGAVLLSVFAPLRHLANAVMQTGIVVALAAWPLLAAFDRMTWIETLQNRVAASFKIVKGHQG